MDLFWKLVFKKELALLYNSSKENVTTAPSLGHFTVLQVCGILTNWAIRVWMFLLAVVGYRMRTLSHKAEGWDTDYVNCQTDSVKLPLKDFKRQCSDPFWTYVFTCTKETTWSHVEAVYWWTYTQLLSTIVFWSRAFCFDNSCSEQNYSLLWKTSPSICSPLSFSLLPTLRVYTYCWDMLLSGPLFSFTVMSPAGGRAEVQLKR